MSDELKRIEDWLTPEEAAARLGTTERALAKWREKEIGPPYRKMGTGKNAPVRYPADLFAEWMRSQTLVMPARSCEAA